MKKILTLFVMLLCGWSIVSAQAPVFGYQAVVRTAANELVVNTPVGVTVDVMKEGSSTPLYSESHTGLTTDTLGMLSILVGTGTPSSAITTLTDIDWTKANVIRATITANGNTIEVETPVLAVPYALQADKFMLTTEQIVAYLSDPATDIEDYKEIMDSLVNNEESNGLVWRKIKNRFATYLKDHRTKAVEVASTYLAHADASDLQALYNELLTKPQVVTALVNIAKQRALDNKDFAVEVLVAYLSQLTTSEVDQIRDALLQHEDEIIPYVVKYAKDQRPFILSVAAYFLQNATAAQVSGAISHFNNETDMKQAFVDDLFYSYLDEYLGASSASIDADAIGSQVRNTMDSNNYLQKKTCTSGDVDICDIWEEIEP